MKILPRHMHRQAEREHEQFIVNIVLPKITKIKAFIHNTKFSSNYTYTEVNTKLVKLYSPKNKKKYLQRQPYYTGVAFGSLKNGRITVYFNPIIPGMPYTYFTTTDSSYNLFIEIYNALPDLFCSNIEYTIDIFCKDHVTVGRLFHILRKNMYFSRGTETNTIGGYLDGEERNNGRNSVYQVNSGSRSRYIKIYERGEDTKKIILVHKPGYWNLRDCDRVRIEVTYKRPKLKAKNPENMKELILTPKIDQLLGDKTNLRIIQEIIFKRFTSHANLPSPWDYYPAQDKHGHANCFQEEYLQAKHRGIKNISQYVNNYDLFNKLKNRIEAAILGFEENWGE